MKPLFNGPQPETFADSKKFILSRSFSGQELQIETENLLSELARMLEQQGCKLIGHIKALLQTDNSGQLMFSITSFTEKPACKGSLANDVSSITFTINVIVYGIEPEALKKICHQVLHKYSEEIS